MSVLSGVMAKNVPFDVGVTLTFDPAVTTHLLMKTSSVKQTDRKPPLEA